MHFISKVDGARVIGRPCLHHKIRCMGVWCALLGIDYARRITISRHTTTEPLSFIENRLSYGEAGKLFGRNVSRKNGVKLNLILNKYSYPPTDSYSIVRTCWIDDPNSRPSFKYLASQFEKLLGNNAKYIEMESSAISNPMYCTDEAKLTGTSQPDLTACLEKQLGEPESLDHLWQTPKICYDTQECPSSREFSTNFSMEFQQPPPPSGYDVPRPLIETATTEQTLRYENDLRFPLNIRKSVCNDNITSNSQNGSKAGAGCGVDADRDNNDALTAHYTVPVTRGRSYVDMTNKTFIPDNLDSDEFEKNLSKTISFRFSSLLNLKEQDLGAV